MNDYVPQSVIRAAETRAAGASWLAAATEAGWKLVGLKRWIRDHPRLWARELGRARRELQEAASDEAVTALRQQLRADDPKTITQAAIALTGRFSPRRGKPKTADAKQPPTFDEMMQDPEWRQAYDAGEEYMKENPMPDD